MLYLIAIKNTSNPSTFYSNPVFLSLNMIYMRYRLGRRGNRRGFVGRAGDMICYNLRESFGGKGEGDVPDRGAFSRVERTPILSFHLSKYFRFLTAPPLFRLFPGQNIHLSKSNRVLFGEGGKEGSGEEGLEKMK